MRRCKQCGGTFLSGETSCTYCGEPLVHGDRGSDARQRKARKASDDPKAWDFSAFGQTFRKQNTTPPPIKMFEQNTQESTYSLLLAALLAFTVGTFGVHWFYLGNVRRGVLYALFFWSGIPAILGFIDGIRFVVKFFH